MTVPRRLRLLLPIVLLAAAGPARAQFGDLIDVATLSTDPGNGVQRTHGSDGSGNLGVPVAGGFDLDDDGFPDHAFAAFTASPFGRSAAGEVYLIFGDGTIGGTRDTGVSDPGILVIAGTAIQEATGSEIWMDDVTGDGVGDLLIARQNFDPGSRNGAGALTIVVGGPELALLAEAGSVLDLASPPDTVSLTTIVGAGACNRFGMWVRTGDVTGDGIADFVVGADQEGATHRGAAYLVRGGAQLATAGLVDLAAFGTTVLAGHIARIERASSDGNHSHFGATVQIGDLDGNGRSEVLVAATLNRAGGQLDAVGCPGNQGRSDPTRDGTLYIAWDDNFTGDPWAAGLSFAIDAAPGTSTRIDGNDAAVNFGEEILAGYDFDGSGTADLFVGDIVGDQSGAVRTNAGSGWVLYDAAGLAGLDFDMQDPPPGLVYSLIWGARSEDVAADTAAAGDFDGDGIDDLAMASPCADPNGRASAGAWHLFHGRPGPWPATIDLLAPPPPDEVFISEVWGALPTDVLGYSAASGHMDGDGRVDLITNEMTGDGLQPGTADVGNVVILSGALFVPEPAATTLCVAGLISVALLRRLHEREGRGPRQQPGR